MSNNPSKPKWLPPPIIAVVGWLIPGAGYWLIGQRSRALAVGIPILTLFVLGLLIGGMRVVEAPAQGVGILQRPWFIAQILAGPIALIANYIGSTWGGGAPYSHVRVFEIGTLYAAIAGMMNLMALIDAAYRSANNGNR